MEKKNSLSRTFLVNMLVVTILSICLFGGLWTWQQYSIFHKESKALRTRMLDSYKTLLKTQVQKSVDYIEHRKSLTQEQFGASLQIKVNDAYTVSSHLYTKYKDQKSAQEIQNIIKESLRPMRFNQGRGYFFILDLQGEIQLQSDLPEFENINMLNSQKDDQVNVVRNMIDLVKEKQEGFYQYKWTKPGMPRGTFQKRAYIRLFKPYNWIIGTGEYLDDFEANVKSDVLRYIETIQFEKDGYIFATQWDGTALTKPAPGKNMLGVTDVNGVRIVQEFIRLSKSDGGFLRYVMPKFKGLKPDPKLSYVQGIKDWEWYVGAGIYIDDIENAVDAKQAEMTRDIKDSLTQMIIILFFLIVFTYFFVHQISLKVRNSFDRFARFFEKGARESAVIDPDAMEYEEFEKLAHSANDMIKARMQAKSALVENEKKYRLIVENLNDLIIKLDCDKKLIFASQTYCDLYEKTEKEVLNQTFVSLAMETEREAVGNALNNLDKPPYTAYHEEGTLTKLGHRWIAWSSRAVLNSENQPVEYVAVGRDITEKRQAQDASKENQAWLQHILDSIQAGVVVIDFETHKILELNRAAVEMIGTDKQKIVNRTCHNYICPNDMGKCPVTDLGQCIDQSDRELITASGTHIPILKTVTRSRINGKEYLIESFLDMRDKKHLESMLLQAQKMEAIGTLAGGIAHDFNNILFPILGYAEMLIEEIPKDSPSRVRVKRIHSAGLRARDLVQQILAFSRQGENEPNLIKIQPIIKEALKLIRSTIPATISIDQQIEAQCGKVKADPTQIHQIIMNLTTNAYHAMAENGGKIEVCLREIEMAQEDLINKDLKNKDFINPDLIHPDLIHSEMTPGPYACLTVTDTGIGMDRSLTEKIFDPFFTTKEKGKGTGMGLSVVHGVVKKMNGAIRVNSRLGSGTEFHVYLPIIKTVSDNNKRREDAPISGGTESVLLVDDEPDILTMEQQILERLGYQVTSCTGSMEALAVFRAGPDKFDLVITDMAMPNMPGDKLSAELINIRPDMPVLLCTGFSENMSEEKADSLGIKGLLLKPIAIQDLARKMREVLDMR
jgi:PAS domain S-box-containing protein